MLTTEHPADVLGPELLLTEEVPLTIRYTPFDHVDISARVAIVGITPGLRQLFLACQTAQALRSGKATSDAVHQASAASPSAGRCEPTW